MYLVNTIMHISTIYSNTMHNEWDDKVRHEKRHCQKCYACMTELVSATLLKAEISWSFSYIKQYVHSNAHVTQIVNLLRCVRRRCSAFLMVDKVLSQFLRYCIPDF